MIQWSVPIHYSHVRSIRKARSHKMKHFLVYTNLHKDPNMETARYISDYLTKNGQKATIVPDSGDWKESDSETSGRLTEMPTDVDCLLVLGGDGTVLQAARETCGLGIPMLGVNLGTVGYLTQVEPAQLPAALDRLIAGEYTQEKRMMLSGFVSLRDGSRKESWSLNDIVITRRGILQVMQFHIYVNGKFLNTYNADGVIVTTPTGSTGYNLSAGGPIVSPQARMIILTPICPHSLNQRSIIFSAEDIIEIEIPEGREGRVQTAEVNFDGTHTIALVTGDRIRVAQSEKSTEFIQLNDVSFLEVLHKKMYEG